MRLSCQEHMLGERPMTETLSIIELAGFDGVDVPSATLDAPGFAARMARSPLTLASVYSQIRAPSLLDASAAGRASATAEVIHRARQAAEFGANNLILVPVFGPARLTIDGSEDEVSALETALLLVALKEIAVELGDTPIRVVMEPLNREQTHFLTDPSRAADLCRRLDEPRIATMVDTYHCHKEGQDAVAQVAAVAEQLALMHYSDSDRLLPGEGEVDFGSVTSALANAGYDGWVGWECRKIESADDVAALGRSVAHVRQLEQGIVA